jgi:hypothetical protein
VSLMGTALRRLGVAQPCASRSSAVHTTTGIEA